jgi:hypothetical protein
VISGTATNNNHKTACDLDTTTITTDEVLPFVDIYGIETIQVGEQIIIEIPSIKLSSSAGTATITFQVLEETWGYLNYHVPLYSRDESLPLLSTVSTTNIANTIIPDQEVNHVGIVYTFSWNFGGVTNPDRVVLQVPLTSVYPNVLPVCLPMTTNKFTSLGGTTGHILAEYVKIATLD